MIRPAAPEEHGTLTEISFASKGVWNYPQAWFDIWESELTITPDYIEKNGVWVIETEAGIVGYYSLTVLEEEILISGIPLPAGTWLEHMFIRPEHLEKGLGRRLFDHALAQCRDLGVTRLGILADPHARGFYEKQGCTFIREYPSTIEGRTTPLLEMDV